MRILKLHPEMGEGIVKVAIAQTQECLTGTAEKIELLHHQTPIGDKGDVQQVEKILRKLSP